LIWEASRLVVDHRKDRLAGCGNVGGILLSGIMEYACRIGLTHLVSVSDARTERLLKGAGWHLNRLGEPHLFEGCRIVGEITEISVGALARIRTRYGISGSVLPVEEDHLKAA
jgi:acyl homoserine lactone synthase